MAPTGGSGFIAAHVLDVLLEYGHSVVATVRSQAKAEKIQEAKSKYGKDKLDFAIVEDIAQPDGKAMPTEELILVLSFWTSV